MEEPSHFAMVGGKEGGCILSYRGYMPVVQEWEKTTQG